MYKIEIIKKGVWEARLFKEVGGGKANSIFELKDIIRSSGYPDLLKKISGSFWFDKMNK